MYRADLPVSASASLEGYFQPSRFSKCQAHEVRKTANGRIVFFCFEVLFMLRFVFDFPDTPRKKGIEEICRDPLLASVTGSVLAVGAGLLATLEGITAHCFELCR